jgi:hypothetical protein
MAAADIAMDACLARIGFNQPAVLVIRSHGVTNAEAFRTISYQAMGQFVETIVATRVPQQVPAVPPVRGNQAAQAQAAVAAAAAAAVPPQPVTMPYTALRGIKALRAWLDYRYVRGEDLDVDLFDNAVRERWTLRVDVLDDNIRNPPGKNVTSPPPLLNFNNWAVWEQQFITYISNFRGSMCAVPLTYLLRKDDVPTADTMARVFDDVDEALVATFRLDSPVYRADTTRLYDLLKPLVIQGSCYSFILPVDSRRNGREAFLILKNQAEGPAQLARRRTLAYAQLNTKYGGWSRRFSFDDYIAVYQQAFNELTYLGEVISETKKVNDFLSNITDPKFDTIKTFITGDANLNNNFEICQQRARQMVDQVTTQNANKRNVSAVATRPAARSNKRQQGGKAGGRRQRPMNRGIFHYQKDVWDKMTEEQKRKLRDDRARAKAAKANIRAKAEKDVRNVSAVFSVPHHPSSDSELTVERDMFELDLAGVDDMNIDDADTFQLNIPPVPLVKPPTPLCNNIKLTFHRSGDPDVDLLIHNKAEALYKQAVAVWTDDVFAYGETIRKYKEMGRALPIPEYPAHPPPFETYANHVKETYERGIDEFNKIQVLPKDPPKPPIAVAAHVHKRVPTQAVASMQPKLTKQNPSNTVEIDQSSQAKRHPFMRTIMGDIKEATARSLAMTTGAKAEAVTKKPVGTKKPPPATDQPKPTLKLTINGTKPGRSVVAAAAKKPASRNRKGPRKTPKGWEKDYSDDESASDDDDEGFSIITHDHADTKN